MPRGRRYESVAVVCSTFLFEVGSVLRMLGRASGSEIRKGAVVDFQFSETAQAFVQEVEAAIVSRQADLPATF